MNCGSGRGRVSEKYLSGRFIECGERRGEKVKIGLGFKFGLFGGIG